MDYSPEGLQLIALNVGYAVHEKDWNWKDVCSPFARLYYVTDGCAQVKTEKGIFNLEAGKMYLVPSFVRHDNICTSHFEHYYIHVYENSMSSDRIFEDFELPFQVNPGNVDLELFKRLCELNPQMSLPQSNPLSYDNQATLFQNIRINRMNNLKEQMETCGILSILVSRFLEHARPKQFAGDDRIKSVITHIRKHIETKITVNELAAMASLSIEHFIRMFKKETGMTPVVYLTKTKIERAMAMLVTSQMPVKAVALSLGFDDSSYFNRVFRKNVGMTPQQYRDKT